MPSIREIVEESGTPAGRAFDLTIQALIVVSLATFSLETLPNLSTAARRTLQIVEMATVLIFTLEYLLRLWMAENRLRFIFSFFGIIDLLAIAPFYLSTTIDLRSVRALRLLRLFRILKLARYSAAIQRFHRALIIAREELVLFFAATSVVLFLAAAGIHHFESVAQPDAFSSVFHSLWWAVATLTTVGYGDVYPVTVGGRIFTFVVLLAGLGVVSVPAGLVATALSEARRMEEAGDGPSAQREP